MNHVPSEQQQDVLKWVREGKGSLNLIARAGCGKTATILMAASEAKGDIHILSFNKSISEEIKAKLASMGLHHVKATTVHSVGMSAWIRVAPSAKLDAGKTNRIIKTLSCKSMGSFIHRNEFSIKSLVSAAKQNAVGYLYDKNDMDVWKAIGEKCYIEDEVAHPDKVCDVISVAKQVFDLSLEMNDEAFDFDDMLLAPLCSGAPIPKKDWVFVDEAQDTNPLRRAIAIQMIKPIVGRLAAVGDDRQAIYGFTGADHDSMNLIKQDLDSETLYLTHTYRCPKALVREANKIVPDLVAMDSAPEGLLRSVDVLDAGGVSWFIKEKPAETSVVLCRNTKPLVEQAYLMIKSGIACKIEGRDIGEGLKILATRWSDIDDLSDLKDELDEYADREIKKWMRRKKRNPSSKRRG